MRRLADAIRYLCAAISERTGLISTGLHYGHRTVFDDVRREYVYLDTGETVGARECAKCSRACIPGEPDPCIGTLPDVVGACCGHGDRSSAYVAFEDGTVFRGFDQVERGKQRVNAPQWGDADGADGEKFACDVARAINAAGYPHIERAFVSGKTGVNDGAGWKRVATVCVTGPGRKCGRYEMSSAPIDAFAESAGVGNVAVFLSSAARRMHETWERDGVGLTFTSWGDIAPKA